METAYSLNIIADTNIVEKLVIKINFRNDFILFVNIGMMIKGDTINLF